MKSKNHMGEMRPQARQITWVGAFEVRQLAAAFQDAQSGSKLPQSEGALRAQSSGIAGF